MAAGIPPRMRTMQGSPNQVSEILADSSATHALGRALFGRMNQIEPRKVIVQAGESYFFVLRGARDGPRRRPVRRGPAGRSAQADRTIRRAAGTSGREMGPVAALDRPAGARTGGARRRGGPVVGRDPDSTVRRRAARRLLRHPASSFRSHPAIAPGRCAGSALEAAARLRAPRSGGGGADTNEGAESHRADRGIGMAVPGLGQFERGRRRPTGHRGIIVRGHRPPGMRPGHPVHPRQAHDPEARAGCGGGIRAPRGLVADAAASHHVGAAAEPAAAGQQGRQRLQPSHALQGALRAGGARLGPRDRRTRILQDAHDAGFPRKARLSGTAHRPPGSQPRRGAIRPDDRPVHAQRPRPDVQGVGGC